ncbi:putative pectate lyase 12 [Tanacetum coccineum]
MKRICCRSMKWMARDVELSEDESSHSYSTIHECSIKANSGGGKMGNLVGFGQGAMGGKQGRTYVVSDSTHEDHVKPPPGTL